FEQAKEAFAKRGITSETDPDIIIGWENTFKNEFVGEARKRIDQLRYNDNLNDETLAEVEQYLKDMKVDEEEYAGVFYTAKEEIKAEKGNTVNDNLLLQLDDLSSSKVEQAFADAGLTAEDNPELYSYWNQKGKAADRQKAHEGFTNLLYDNVSPAILDDEIQRLVDGGVLDYEKDREYIEELKNSLGKENLKAAQKKVDQLTKNNELSPERLEQIKAEHDITDEEFSNTIMVWESALETQNINLFENEMTRYMNEGTLDDVAIANEMSRFGIDVQKNQPLLYKWTTQREEVMYDKIGGDLTMLQVSENLGRGSVDKAFADAGLSPSDNPELYSYWSEKGKTADRQKAHVDLTNMIYENTSISALNTEIQKFIDDGILDQKDDLGYIEELRDALNNENYINAQKRVDQLKKDNMLTAGELEEIKTQYGITDEEFSSTIAIWEADLENQNIGNFENEMVRQVLAGGFGEADIAGEMSRFGLDIDTNQSLLYKWTTERKTQMYQDVSDEYNSLDAQGNIVPQSVQELIEKHGLTYEKDGALIKTMMDEAQANLDAHIAEVERKLSDAGQGFSTDDYSDRMVVNAINANITGLRNRTVTTSEALAELDKNISSLTKTDYERLYSDIVTTSNRNAYADNELFKEQVYNPFL
ncbi:MAG: hypothetical protein GX585_06130, partial [Clostridiales bacterium]|nr:hypothetical protein [Clostridiales bacterium]